MRYVREKKDKMIEPQLLNMIFLLLNEFFPIVSIFEPKKTYLFQNKYNMQMIKIINSTNSNKVIIATKNEQEKLSLEKIKVKDWNHFQNYFF